MKILMVCAGNICRSRLAHGILEKKVKEQNLDWVVDSAGTHGMHAGDLPDSRSVEIASRKGLDITQQRSRKIRSIDLQEFDLVFCMDNHNLRDVMSMCISEEEKAKVKMIMNEVEPGRNVSVPDPYYGGASGFDNVYDMLELACEKIVENYK